MLNMLSSMFFFIYILGSAACHILGLYFINKLYTELYLFGLYHCHPPLIAPYSMFFYIAMRETEIQCAAFIFWVHLLTCTYILALYIFINYSKFGLFISVILLQ